MPGLALLPGRPAGPRLARPGPLLRDAPHAPAGRPGAPPAQTAGAGRERRGRTVAAVGPEQRVRPDQQQRHGDRDLLQRDVVRHGATETKTTTNNAIIVRWCTAETARAAGRTEREAVAGPPALQVSSGVKCTTACTTPGAGLLRRGRRSGSGILTNGAISPQVSSPGSPRPGPGSPGMYCTLLYQAVQHGAGPGSPAPRMPLTGLVPRCPPHPRPDSITNTNSSSTALHSNPTASWVREHAVFLTQFKQVYKLPQLPDQLYCFLCRRTATRTPRTEGSRTDSLRLKQMLSLRTTIMATVLLTSLMIMISRMRSSMTMTST